MKQPTMFFFICMSICAVSIGTTNGKTLLTATPLKPIVGSSVSLTCYNTGTNFLGVSTWYKNSAQVATLLFTDSGCLEATQFELDNYTTVCTSNESFTLTFESVTLDMSGTSWSCEQASIKSNSVVLTIKVPVKSLSFDTPDSDNLTLRENISKRISCSTSFSRPRANITWYITERTELFKVFLQESDSSQITSTDFVSTRSTLHINLNRTYNQWILVCEAENIQGYKAVSKNTSLNIIYPTNKPYIQCTKNGIYKVIQNTKGNITCSVDGGNPAGTLHWNCAGDKTENQGPQNKVTLSVVWNATQSQNCTCTSTNIAGRSSTSVTIEVLYPPVVKEAQNKTVFEGDSVTLQCDVIRAHPSVNLIKWTSSNHSVSDATFMIRNILRTDDMVYTCTAINTMDPSCQDVVNGTSSKSLHLEVLFPPDITITQGKTFTVKEGDSFSYTCPVVPGNPSTTSTTWRRSNHTNTWSSSELLILNVTRYDDSVYICYASSIMVNSNGATKIGNVSAAIRLIVQFKTNVTDFYIQSYRHNSTVVVTEHANLTFECCLQSNPTANVSIYKTEYLVNSSNANKLFYYTTASCSGGPVSYSCHGYNSLSHKPSTRLIDLFIYCKPRQDIHDDVQFNVTSAINQTVTLSYRALAYPHPWFVWYRNKSSITTRDSRFIISSTDLQTNLTIPNVEERDFGYYTLTVSNDVGYIKESFHVKPDGVPDVATHLTQDDSSTTITSIGLKWRSGFKNGSEQFFSLIYSKQTEGDWQSATVQDTGPTGTTIHYNITKLSSDAYYDIILFAVNAKGRSKYNATLSCRTKPTANAISSKNDSAIVGGTLSGVAFLCGIVFSVFIYRRRVYTSSKSNKHTECSTIQSPIPVTYENLKIAPLEYQSGIYNDRTSETNVDHTYEGLSRGNNGKEDEYTRLDHNSKYDPKQTYENLKIQL